MNSAEDELEAAMWSALTRHKVTCERADELMTDLVAAAVAYAAGDSDALTAERRMVLHEATAPRPGQTSRSDAPGGCAAPPRELDPSGSRAGRPEEATLSTGRSIPAQVRAGPPQAVDNSPVDNAAAERARLRALVPYNVNCCDDFPAAVADLLNEHEDTP